MQFALPQTYGMQKQWPDDDVGTSSVVVAADTLEALLRNAIDARLFTLAHLEEAVAALKKPIIKGGVFKCGPKPNPE